VGFAQFHSMFTDVLATVLRDCTLDAEKRSVRSRPDFAFAFGRFAPEPVI
jgi:ketosteroid isomerase-like protein